MKVKSISYAGKQDVYNMEVEDTHSFIIQGGVVSHNCADEARYVCMARQIKPRETVRPDHYYESPQSMFLDIKKEDIVAKPKRQRMEVITSGEEE